MDSRFAFGKRATNISKQSRVLLAHNSAAENGKPKSRAIHPISARLTEPHWNASRRKVFGESSSQSLKLRFIAPPCQSGPGEARSNLLLIGVNSSSGVARARSKSWNWN